MKTFIKKVMVVLVVLAAIVDWPVEIDAQGRFRFIVEAAKEGKSLLSRCSKETKTVEQEVNKATKETKETINSAAKDPNTRVGAVAGSRMLNNATRSNAQTTSQSRVVSCTKCYGSGTIQGNDGYVYSCSRCNGTGKIFIK